MGLDVDRLLDGLTTYRNSLYMHLQKLQEDFDLLMNTYYGLNLQYEGAEAEEFKNSWHKTAIWFETYADNAKQLCKTLEDRIESLRVVASSLYNKQPGSSATNLENHLKNVQIHNISTTESPHKICTGRMTKIETGRWHKKLEDIGKTDTVRLNLNSIAKLEEILGGEIDTSGNCPNQAPDYYRVNRLGGLEVINPYRGGVNYLDNCYYKRRTSPYGEGYSEEMIQKIINRVKAELNRSSTSDYYKFNHVIHDVIKYQYEYYVSPYVISGMIKEIVLRFYRNPASPDSYRKPYLRFDRSWSELPLE